MLEINDLWVHYGRVPAVRGISLEVHEGEVVTIVGPNGAGKSTTLATIVGLLSPARGTIAFEGRPVANQPPERIVRRGIALVPEGRHIFGTLTVAENLQLGTTSRRDRRNTQSDRDSVLDRFPALRTYYGSSAAKLSGGEQQQLALARALLSRPRLLLLDEPSLGLAPLVVDLVFDVLADLRSDGLTVLLVEQNATRAVEFADRSYVMRSGTIVLKGTRDELRREIDLGSLYLGA